MFPDISFWTASQVSTFQRGLPLISTSSAVAEYMLAKRGEMYILSGWKDGHLVPISDQTGKPRTYIYLVEELLQLKT